MDDDDSHTHHTPQELFVVLVAAVGLAHSCREVVAGLLNVWKIRFSAEGGSKCFEDKYLLW